MSPEPQPAQSGRVPKPRDTKSVLYEAAVEAVQERAARVKDQTSRSPKRKGRFPWVLILLAIGVAGAVLLVLRPAWLAGPNRIPPESPGVSAASLRVVLVREREMVFNYARRFGRLPASLAEAGGLAPDLELRREGSGFALAGRAGDSLITIRSTDTVTAFLGDSFSRLRHRSAP